jgi:hypothetical protein
MRRIVVSSGVGIVLVVCGIAPAATPSQADRDALVQLHKELIETTFLRGESALLAATALPNLIVVPPGGVVERRDQVIRGLPNVAAESVQIDDVVVADYGATAVVVARVTAKRTAGGVAGSGRSRMMSVFVRDQEQWRLLARSITPCIERAIEAGRC